MFIRQTICLLGKKKNAYVKSESLLGLTILVKFNSVVPKKEKLVWKDPDMKFP